MRHQYRLCAKKSIIERRKNKKMNAVCAKMEEWVRFHPEVWQSLADKLWDGFVDYKDIPFGDKEIWYEQKN